MKKILLFLSFLLMSIGMWGTTVTVQISTYASSHNWSDATKYTSVNIDENVTAIVSGGGNTGKYYTNGNNWRMYQTENATITISTSLGTLNSVTFTYSSSNSGVLKDGNTTVSSGTEYSINGTSKTFSVGNTSSATNGQVRITAISVTYTESNINVTGVSITDTLKLIEGNLETLTPIITPENATNKKVTWGSTNTDVATVSNGEVNAVSIGTTKVWVKTEDGNKTDTCVVIVEALPTTNYIDIARWDTNAVYINIDEFDAVSAVIEGAEPNIATELFFSKYFEALGGIKLLGIYNGTKNPIDLSTYSIKVAQGTKTSIWGGESGNYIYSLSGLGTIYQKQEIILISYTNNSPDPDIIGCILEKNEHGLDYQLVGSGQIVHSVNNVGLQFSGDDAVGLFKSSTLIDIIGAGTSSAANVSGLTSSKTSTDLGHYHDDYCWVAVNSEDTLSTNLCLLIRKNTVHSGDTAVKYNKTDFVTLATEWIGKQVIKDNTSTCHNFDYVGTYNYDSIYSVSADLIHALQEDGTYKLEISQLDTLSCTNIKIIAQDADDNTIQELFKVPIMISENKTSSQVLSKHGVSCPTCDLVVMHGATLTIDNALSNRDVKIYAGSRLLINSGKTYTANSLSLRKTDDSNPYLTLNGTLALSGDSSLYFDLYTDPSEWRWIALPEQFDIRNIKLSNGKEVIYGEDFLIKTYDGEYRSINKKNGWKQVSSNKVFNPGEGFIFGIAGEGTVKQEYRFKFSNLALTREVQNKELTWDSLRGWGNTDPNLAPNHKGWNLISNPYMDLISTNVYEPIRIGHLIHSETTPWDGQWIVDPNETEARLRYRVVYERGTAGEDGNGYSSELLDGIQLEPFSTFFVQLNGNPSGSESITIDKSKKRSIVSRNREEDDEVFLRIAVGEKKTGMFISDKFNEDYEPGDDLESRQSIYQNIGGYKLLYSAIPDSTLINGIYVCSNGGEITLDDKVIREKFEYIYIKDGDNWYNLLYEPATVEGNFIIFAKVRRNNTTTNLELIPTKGLYKFTDGKNVYINHNNKIYNITGGIVQ